MKQKLSSGYEITLDKGHYVEGQMKHSELWFRARILDCKLSKGKSPAKIFALQISLILLIANYRL